MVLAEEGRQEECDELFHKLLHHSIEVFEPLVDFTIEQPNHPRIAILLKLLGKIGDVRTAPILQRFLEIDVKELRVQAAIGLGWLRARAGLEMLDQLEGNDPEEEVRKEARIAIEEILRDFPLLRPMLKYHERVAIKRETIKPDSQTDIARSTPVGGEDRKRLVGMMPRLLAMKHRAVPLGIGPGGVVSVAVRADLEEDPTELLRTLLGREVQLHGWPLPKIYERILTFYKWGDDDWVQFGEYMTDPAREEIASIVLGNIVPSDLPPPLPDCVDSSEAVQSFLAICARGQYQSAILEYDDSSNRLDITLQDREGKCQSLDSPVGVAGARFMKALRILGNCRANDAGEASGDVPLLGLIDHEHPVLERPFRATVRCENMGGVEVIGLDFVDSDQN